jgi:hypothetical protein
MATEKYVIEVKRKMVEDNGVETQVSQKLNANMPTQTTASINRASIIKNSVVFVQSARVLSTAFNFAKSNYGNITGDAVAQHQIDLTLSVLGEGANLITSFLVGGVAGGTVAMIGTGLKYATEIAQASIDSTNRNAQINQFRERIGNVVSKGGRR